MPGVAPYLGLSYYESDDHDRFFGREQESQEVRALWMSNRLVILYGRSGVGKTSLVRAGVIPSIMVHDADVLPVGRVSHSSAFPTATVPHHNPYTFALLSAWSKAASPTSLAGVTVAAFLLARPEITDRYDTTLPLLAAIDQFEELFSDLPHRRAYREEFVTQLAEAVEALPRLRLLISVREEFVARLLPYETMLVRHGRARFQVRSLRPEAALEAVTRPLKRTRRSFAPGVAERLVDDLRTTTITNSLGEIREVVADTVEPAHLQVVCSALWEALPERVRTISFQHLQDHGNIDRALADFCTRAVAEVATQHGVPESDLWDWLTRVFITDLGTRGTVYEGISTTGGLPNSVARELEERHILRAEERAGSRWYELLHDRLIDPIRRGNRPWATVEALTHPSPAVYLRTAESALADGDLTLAEKYADDAIRFGGEFADLRTRAEAGSFLGSIAAQQGRIEEAEDRYRGAAALFDSVGDQTAVGRVQAALGRFLLDRRRFGVAVGELQAASTRLAGDVDLRVDLASAYWHAGQHQAATAVLGAALTISPAHVDALVLRGRISAEAGDPESALEDLVNAARLRPSVAQEPAVLDAQERARDRLDTRQSPTASPATRSRR
jgi:tetratricopeptide (TPR) repeat protein